jgi:hypothetical protein
MLQECDQAIRDLLQDESRPIQKAVAAVLTGVMAKGSITLSRACAAIPGAAETTSKQRRGQRLLANPHLGVTRVQRRLMTRLLRTCHGRIHLLLDATTTGVTHSHAGTMTLMLALAWHDRAIPLWWKSWPTYERGQQWRHAIAEMIAVVEACRPPDAEIVLLADRQFPGRPILTHLAAAGWHYALRVRRTFHVRLAEGTSMAMGDLIPAPGACTQVLEQVVVCGTQTNVVATWPTTAKDPWLLVTDLPPTLKRCAEYRIRTWEEALFRDLKSMGFGWDASRVRIPDRVERLLLILALAMLWTLALAQRLVRRGKRYLVDARPKRHLSYFHLGQGYLDHLVSNDQRVPCLLSLWAESHAA